VPLGISEWKPAARGFGHLRDNGRSAVSKSVMYGEGNFKPPSASDVDDDTEWE